jgi:hypothetical protein
MVQLVYDAHDGQKVIVFAQSKAPEPVKDLGKISGKARSSDQKGDAVLTSISSSRSVGLLNLSTKKRTVLLRHPRNLSLPTRGCSDCRWIAFPVPLDASAPGWPQRACPESNRDERIGAIDAEGFLNRNIAQRPLARLSV